MKVESREPAGRGAAAMRAAAGVEPRRPRRSTRNRKLDIQDSDKLWTPLELIRRTAEYLEERGIDEPRHTAELLLAEVLGLKRLDLYLQFDRPVSTDELARLRSILRRRVRREPVQYIAGRASFRHLTLGVDRRVLIPRPETELLVGEVLAWAGERQGLDVVDIGTGSGAIALSLRHEGRFGRVVATDVSAAALEVARENRDATVGVQAGVELREGPGFEPLAGEWFDVIVSNPPYVAEHERSDLPPEVVDWEPPIALFGGADGLDVIRSLVAGAPSHLRSGGLLALEIGADQGPAVADLVAGNASYRSARIVKDLAGRDRIVLAEVY